LFVQKQKIRESSVTGISWRRLQQSTEKANFQRKFGRAGRVEESPRLEQRHACQVVSTMRHGHRGHFVLRARKRCHNHCHNQPRPHAAACFVRCVHARTRMHTHTQRALGYSFWSLVYGLMSIGAPKLRVRCPTAPLNRLPRSQRGCLETAPLRGQTV